MAQVDDMLNVMQETVGREQESFTCEVDKGDDMERLRTCVLSLIFVLLR